MNRLTVVTIIMGLLVLISVFISDFNKPTSCGLNAKTSENINKRIINLMHDHRITFEDK